jgi:hypothetical protein
MDVPARARPRTLGAVALALTVAVELATIGVAVAARAAEPLALSAVGGDRITAFVVTQGVVMLVPIAVGAVAVVTRRGRRLALAALALGLVFDLLVVWGLFAALGALGGYLFGGGAGK